MRKSFPLVKVVFFALLTCVFSVITIRNPDTEYVKVMGLQSLFVSTGLFVGDVKGF